LNGTWPGTRLWALIASMDPERRALALASRGLVGAIHGGRKGCPPLRARVRARIAARDAARREKRGAA
jgi:hypothetical protein